MKMLASLSGSLALLIIVGLLLWPRLHGSTQHPGGYRTTIDLSGTEGAPFKGEYLRKGKRVAFSGVLPWSVTESNLSGLEILKTRMTDTLILNAHGGGSMVSARATPGTKGVRVRMEGGWSIEFLR